MRTIVCLLLALFAALVLSCDEATQYEKDGQCCKKCGPGKRMRQNTDCNDPICPDCEDGEYQDGYTTDTKCKRQHPCDPNLNFRNQTNPSKTKATPCECIPDHHCSSTECISCVKNKVCKPGEQIKTQGSRMSDTVCEPCPDETFSSEHAATKCQPWKECSTGHIESVPGTPTSDRSCELHSNVRLGVAVFFGLVAVLGGVFIGLFFCYKKGRTGSACLEKKLQHHCPALFKGIDHTRQPEILTMENEVLQTVPPPNEPQEDEDDHFKQGLSANGMPVDQDHSKMSLISQPETSAESCSNRF